MRNALNVFATASLLLTVACGGSAGAINKEEVPPSATPMSTAVGEVTIATPAATAEVTPTEEILTSKERTEAALAAVLQEVEAFIDPKAAPIKGSEVEGDSDLFFTASVKRFEHEGEIVLWYDLSSTLPFHRVDGSRFWDVIDEAQSIFYWETHHRLEDIPFDVMYLTLSLGDRPWIDYYVCNRELVAKYEYFGTLEVQMEGSWQDGPPPWIKNEK